MVTGFLQLHTKLEMGDGIRSHQQLEAKDAVQQVLGNVTIPRAGLFSERLMNLVDDEVKERGGTGSWIEDQRVFVGQTFRAIEAVFQQMVNGADDVADDRFGRVINAAHLAHLRVICGEEGFVEVNDRVFLALAFAEILEDFVHVSVVQQGDNILHDPCNGVGQLRTGYLVKELLQERICLWNGARGRVAAELLLFGRVDAGGEKTVYHRLGEHVGELFVVQIGN